MSKSCKTLDYELMTIEENDEILPAAIRQIYTCADLAVPQIKVLVLKLESSPFSVYCSVPCY